MEYGRIYLGAAVLEDVYMSEYLGDLEGLRTVFVPSRGLISAIRLEIC